MKAKTTNIEPYWDLIKRIITESDIVLEILDARMIELSRNEEVEKLIKEIERPVIFIINKSDLVSKEYLKQNVQNLRKEGEVVFVSNKDRNSIKILLYAIKKTFNKFGKSEKNGQEILKYRATEAGIVVGILGYPNTGKSSIINALAHKTKVKVSKKPGTTHGIHWIRIGSKIKLIDSPGIIPLKKDDELRYGLMGAKNPEQLKNPEIVANALVKLFIEKNKKKFENHFDISINEDEKGDFYGIIGKIGGRRGYLIKGGKVDENRVIGDIIRDWQYGKLMI